MGEPNSLEPNSPEPNMNKPEPDMDSSDQLARAKCIAGSVADPELPFVTVEDLGILRALRYEAGEFIAEVSPTYSGCPAAAVIEQSILTALVDAGFNARVERVVSPAWTTDWITEAGRRKLLQNGIAPPLANSTSKPALFGKALSLIHI